MQALTVDQASCFAFPAKMQIVLNRWQKRKRSSKTPSLLAKLLATRSMVPGTTLAMAAEGYTMALVYATELYLARALHNTERIILTPKVCMFDRVQLAPQLCTMGEAVQKQNFSVFVVMLFLWFLGCAARGQHSDIDIPTVLLHAGYMISGMCQAKRGHQNSLEQQRCLRPGIAVVSSPYDHHA